MPPQDTIATDALAGQERLPPGATRTPRLPPGAVLNPRGKLAQPSKDAGQKQELATLWSSLSHEERDQIFNTLPATDQAKLAEQLKMFGHATGFSAAPEFGPETLFHVMSGEPMKDPWIRQKFTDLIYKTHNYLPAAGGTVGGVAGGLGGEALFPTGGGFGGSVVGAALGGGAGEAARQGVEHFMGWEDEPLSPGERAGKIGKEAAWQGALEIPGQLIGKLLRPSLSKAIAKLYYAGGLDAGDRRIKGAVEAVYEDLARVEKAGYGKATTVGDFIDVMDETKKQIGQEVDQAMIQPITQNGRQVMLGHAHADTTGIQNAINGLLTKNPSIVKEAAINPTGKSAAYLQRVKDEAEKYQKGIWTYGELADKRIRLNNDLEALYSLPRGEQRAFLLDHPDLQIAKEEADAIRDVTYRQMDLASGHPLGTTEKLQTKRGIIMELSSDADRHLRRLATASRQTAGMPLGERINVSTYGTSSGHPGVAAHRLHRLLPGRKTEEEVAGKQVARAFGHTAGTKVGTAAASRPGMEVLNLPLRVLFTPETPERDTEGGDVDQGETAEAPAPDKFLTQKLPGLVAEAKQRKPGSVNQGKTYRQTATSANGHKIGTDDGAQWFDVQTGQRVK